MSASGWTLREAILRRRALYVATALSTLGGCGEPAARTVPTAQVPPPTAPPATKPPPEPSPPARPHDWRTAFGPTPPLDIPPGLSTSDRARFERLADEVRAIIGKLDALESLVPRDCAVTDPRCDQRWQLLADELHETERRIGQLRPLCGFGPGELPAYVDRVGAHQEHSHGRLELVRAWIEDVMRSTGERSAAHVLWQGHQRRAELAKPVPCLSCMSPSAIRINVQVFFGPGKVGIAPQSEPIIAEVASVLKDHPELRVRVVGHADARERWPEPLSKRRARAVRDRLVKLGVAAERLSVEAAGKTKPRRPGFSPEQRAHNRRVEFEVVPD